MATIDDSARPRYFPLTASRRLEVDYLLSNPAKPVALTVVDRDGFEVESDDVVIALAWRMTRGKRRPRTVVSALRVLLDVAVSRWRERVDADRAARNMAQAEEYDASLDEPVPFVPVDNEPSAPEDTSDLWESCFGGDPEAPAVYLDDADVNAFAAEQSATRRVIRSLDRAAGAR